MNTIHILKALLHLTLSTFIATETAAQNHVLRDHDTSLQISSSEELYKVVRIVDGDTFYAKSEQGITLKYRLIGINTPEFSHFGPVSYTHLRAHETVLDLVCRLLLEKKKK